MKSFLNFEKFYFISVLPLQVNDLQFFFYFVRCTPLISSFPFLEVWTDPDVINFRDVTGRLVTGRLATGIQVIMALSDRGENFSSLASGIWGWGLGFVHAWSYWSGRGAQKFPVPPARAKTPELQ